MAFAIVNSATDSPDDETGKNNSGSADRQAASELQCAGSSELRAPMGKRLAGDM
jgi:hypothetical protein